MHNSYERFETQNPQINWSKYGWFGNKKNRKPKPQRKRKSVKRRGRSVSKTKPTYSAKTFWQIAGKCRKFKPCWSWQGKSHDGYGDAPFRINRRIERRAHRVAFFLSTGIDPIGQVVRHSCDNPICCNPKHLLIGTSADNVADRVKRKRSTRGSAHPCAKLQAMQVLAIRARLSEGETCASLAKEFRVSSALISGIKRRRDWTHLSTTF